jgi:hypothetical protein
MEPNMKSIDSVRNQLHVPSTHYVVLVKENEENVLMVSGTSAKALVYGS